MRTYPSIWFIIVGALLSSCASTRSANDQGLACKLLGANRSIELAETSVGRQEPLSEAYSATSADKHYTGTLTVSAQNLDFVQNLARSAQLVKKRGASYRTLAISAGGQWGAYTAGIMYGLRHNQTSPEPEFDMVTGISTGAMLAPLIFVHDEEEARHLYTTISNGDVYTQRSPLALIFADSLVDTSPLRSTLHEVITDEFVQRIRDEGQKGRVLAVQSVDADLGESVVFDLSAIAEGVSHPCGPGVIARDCILNAILAAAAIPVAFPPIFINGELFVDGGLRQQDFVITATQEVLRDPDAALRSAIRGQEFSGSMVLPAPPAAGSPIPFDLTVIANTDLRVSPQCTPDGLIGIAQRSAGIAIDELTIGSVYRLISEVQREPKSHARYTFADPKLMPECSPSRNSGGAIMDGFDKAFMQCLYKAGCTMAFTSYPFWREDPNDLPEAPIRRSIMVQGANTQREVPDACNV